MQVIPHKELLRTWALHLLLDFPPDHVDRYGNIYEQLSR